MNATTRNNELKHRLSDADTDRNLQARIKQFIKSRIEAGEPVSLEENKKFVEELFREFRN